jgi:hypothetical protein
LAQNHLRNDGALKSKKQVFSVSANLAQKALSIAGRALENVRLALLDEVLQLAVEMAVPYSHELGSEN